MAGGRDRAIERDAFKAELPDSIYHRAGKGGGRDILNRFDYKFLAESLLGSILCRRDVISQKEIYMIATGEKNIDYDIAQIIVKARGIVDWIGKFDA